MALSQDQRDRVIAMAEEAGLDTDEALREAERQMSEGDGSEGDGDEAKQRPEADRFLIGFLPYVRVRELRQDWLGISERIEDDDLPTGRWLLKHGGAHNEGSAGGGGEDE